MQPGTLIAGRYRLDERLAAGGMGEVWRGTDARLNRVVAVKLLHAGLSGNERFRARFHQEAQAVAALQSPGIVQLFDYGEEHSPEGLVSYLIMELVRGRSLAEVLHERGRLSPADTLKVIATAADALDAAHRAHIIHRDIKPGNLLVDQEGSVKIVDFGIASARGQAGLTETGTVMGTLSYASPEQLGGGELTGATDLYSLGIVAYECLAGRTPFPGNDPAAVITAHMTGQPAPLPNDVPPPVAQIVTRCLAKDPRQRFASAAELARACREGRVDGPAGGTTAILPPAAMPPSPAATSPMTQPMTQAMGAPGTGQTAMQPHTRPIDQGGYEAAAPRGRDLPPPRDFEKPGRGPAVPIAIAVAGVLVLVLALVIWNLSGDDEDPADRLASDDPTTSAETADDTGEAADNDDDQGQESDSGDDDWNDQATEDEAPATEDSAPSAPTAGPMPDVTGVPLADAIGQLNNAGFPDVGSQAQSGTPPEEGLCLVDAQDPAGGGEQSYDTQVTLLFWDDGTGCR